MFSWLSLGFTRNHFVCILNRYLLSIWPTVIADAWSKIETTSWFSQLIELA